uniref:dnaJ homolog subfamily C member 2-like n=1 Tax=Fragaria vesca subsp. vesca TaxID=101020 RepID=UPI0005C8A72B|nr:PREDICTED: dnaJ homolog subfamily C member 2-like [Fragaria vesca subsp. vesca]
MGSNGRKQQAAADHYTLLGLSDLREAATPEQIRKAYLISALKYHPDKHTSLILAEPTEAARQAKKEKIDTKFKRIVAAYEVLSDPGQKRRYDSRDDTDDEIPTECAPGYFFQVFGPVFERFARWSANKPVPGLGKEGTPMETVDKFYEFWFKFKISRDFTDKYHYERDKDCAKKQEYLKILKLVKNVYKKDPRRLRREEEEEAKKLRENMEKQMRKEAKASAAARAAARAAEEERRRKEEKEKRAAEAALEQKKVKE